MTTKPKKNRPPTGQAEQDSALAIATTSAVASILGNIFQALRNDDLERRRQELLTQRGHLLKALRQWQSAYAQLEHRLSQAQALHLQAERANEKLLADNMKLRAELALSQKGTGHADKRKPNG